MEDKELFDFFKSRSRSFNEAPDDALWAKIEAELPAPTLHLNGKTTLLTKGLLLIIIAVVVSGVTIFMLPKKKVLKPETVVHEDVIIQSTHREIMHENDTVKKKAVRKPVVKLMPKKDVKVKDPLVKVAPDTVNGRIVNPRIPFAKINGSKKVTGDSVVKNIGLNQAPIQLAADTIKLLKPEVIYFSNTVQQDTVLLIKTKSKDKQKANSQK